MKQYKSLLLLILCFAQVCCKKGFLDTTQTTPVRQQYVVDLKTTNDLLNGVFSDLALYVYYGYSTIYADLIADNIKPTSSGSLSAQYNWTQIATNTSEAGWGNTQSNMNGLWVGGYRVARNASFVLESANRFREENPLKADSINGQALILRALAHFQLVNVFAQPYGYSFIGDHMGIPYVDTSDNTQPITRETVANVYDKMIKDVTTAIPLLPDITQPVNKLVITKNAGKAFLARIYLFKGDYLSAKKLAREVGVNVPIMTGSNYPSKLFTSNESEALFQLPPSSEGVSNATITVYFSGYFFRDANEFLATNDIASLLTENSSDTRKAWVTSSTSGWKIVKFPKAVVTSNIPDGAYYQTIIRSSEMYLTAAECYAKLNMEDSARFYLDAIRKRSNSSAQPSSASGSALIDSIYKERRKELCFENIRVFDLQRIKSGVNRVDATPEIKTLSYPSNKIVAPIPLGDIILSGLNQNPDY